MLQYIMRQPEMLGNPEVEAEGPYAVVLAPTRELAQQVWTAVGAVPLPLVSSGHYPVAMLQYR